MTEINRQPLMLGWDNDTKPGHEHAYFDHDANRYEQIGRAAIAYVVHTNVRRPSAWRLRMLVPNQHGVMCNVGYISTVAGMWFVHIIPLRLNAKAGIVRVTRLSSQADALLIARTLLAIMYP